MAHLSPTQHREAARPYTPKPQLWPRKRHKLQAALAPSVRQQAHRTVLAVHYCSLGTTLQKRAPRRQLTISSIVDGWRLRKPILYHRGAGASEPTTQKHPSVKPGQTPQPSTTLSTQQPSVPLNSLHRCVFEHCVPASSLRNWCWSRSACYYYA